MIKVTIHLSHLKCENWNLFWFIKKNYQFSLMTILYYLKKISNIIFNSKKKNLRVITTLI